MVAKSKGIYRVQDQNLQFILNSISDRIDNLNALRNPLRVPLSRLQRSYGEVEATSATPTVDLGTVVSGDVVVLQVDGDFTLTAAGNGSAEHRIGTVGSAILTNAGTSNMPRIFTTTVSSGVAQYHFHGFFWFSVEVGGSCLIGPTTAAFNSVSRAGGTTRVVAWCLIGLETQ